MSTFRHAGVCLLALLVAAGFLSAQTPGIAGWNSSPVSVISPDGQIALTLSDDGAAGLVYSVKFHGKRLIAESKLGLELVGQQPLGPWMKLAGEQAESADEAYTLPVGKTREVRNHYNGVRADYTDLDGRKLSIEVRAFDDGVAFRYIVPKQPLIGQTRIAHELGYDGDLHVRERFGEEPSTVSRRDNAAPDEALRQFSALADRIVCRRGF